MPEKVGHWEKGFGTFIISLKDDPIVKIGYAGVEQIPNTKFSDIRYGLLPEFQGKGYAFEASKAVLNFTLETGIVSEVHGVAVMKNRASISLLKKLGMLESSDQLYDSDELVTLSTQTRI